MKLLLQNIEAKAKTNKDDAVDIKTKTKIKTTTIWNNGDDE